MGGGEQASGIYLYRAGLVLRRVEREVEKKGEDKK
jgi:hypothetical protein